MPTRSVALALVALAVAAAAQKEVSFPAPDGGLVYADHYGAGRRGIVLAHGGRFDKASWKKQALELERAGFQVLAIDFRGYGQSRGGTASQSSDDGLRWDVLAAVRYLHQAGAQSVAVIGASMGGGAAAEASVDSQPGEIDRLVLLAHSPIDEPRKMKGRKFFAVARDDADGSGTPRLAKIREQYALASQPKKLLVLDGSAHAQAIFETPQGERLWREILRFLSEP